MQKPKETEQLDPEREALRQRIQAAIHGKETNLKKFSRESGMAYPSLRDYLSGLRKPGFDAIATILRHTGVCGDWLLLGIGPMYSDQAKPADVDEGLMGFIAQSIEKKRHELTLEEGHTLRQGSKQSFLYSIDKKDRENLLKLAGKNAIIAASVYNRVAHLGDDAERQKAIAREIETIVRISFSLDVIDAGGFDEE
jgi:lambda repressor-like predicted transcriptional regulator